MDINATLSYLANICSTDDYSKIKNDGWNNESVRVIKCVESLREHTNKYYMSLSILIESVSALSNSSTSALKSDERNRPAGYKALIDNIEMSEKRCSKWKDAIAEDIAELDKIMKDIDVTFDGASSITSNILEATKDLRQ